MSEVQIKCLKCFSDIVLPARPVNNSMTYCPALLSRLRLLSAVIYTIMLVHQGYAFEFEDPYADPKSPKAPKTIETPKASESPSISYVTPIEDTLILTPAPKQLVWVQPMQTYRLIGKVNIGYLIVYPDDQGVYRTGIVPWKDRMNNLTATEEGNILRIKPGTVAKIEQGGILLRANTPYPLIGENNLQQKVQYCVGTFSQVVAVAKSKMQFVANTKAQYLLDELARQDEAMSQYRPERVAVPQSKESNDGESDNHLANYLAEKEASRSHTLRKKDVQVAKARIISSEVNETERSRSSGTREVAGGIPYYGTGAAYDDRRTFSTPRDAWGYADSLSRQNQGTLDSMRESSINGGGAIVGDSRLLENYRPTIRNGRWGVTPFTRDQNPFLHDAVTDTLYTR